MPKPPVGRSESTPWPYWPLHPKHSSLEEGCERNWLINTKEFIANDVNCRPENGRSSLKMTAGNRPELVEKEGTEKIWPATCLVALVLLTRKHYDHQG
jgi:glutamate synthase (NADPH/NADH) small chain